MCSINLDFGQSDKYIDSKMIYVCFFGVFFEYTIYKCIVILTQ